jgi:hypothetical protein
MSQGGLVIGLGGAGLRVTARVRQVLVSGGQGRVPDSLRLLAFDVRKPTPATGKLPQSTQFLIQLLPLEEEDAHHTKPPRHAAREMLLRDLALGAASSLTLRGLAAQLDALRRVGVTEMDAFLVSSSFGNTGSAWLLDIAYLVHHLTHNRIKTRIHAVLIAPEAFERAFFPSDAQRMTNFVVLKELEALQRERDWGSGVSIYGGKHIGSLPGMLAARPFTTVQVLDGQDMNTSPEAGAIPAAADGILCQLDPQASALLEETARQSVRDGRIFSSFGVASLVYPARLVLEQAIQRLLLGMIDQTIPLMKDPDTGRPERLAEPAHVRPDHPYGKLESWLPEAKRSGILAETLRVSAALANPSVSQHQEFKEELAARSVSQWKALLNQCEEGGSAQAPPESASNPLFPYVQSHMRHFLQELGWRIANPDPRLGAPQEYLQKLEVALSTYLQDLDWAVEEWRRKGEHSETVSKSLNDARKELNQRQSSLLGRLLPQGAQDAKDRYAHANQAHARLTQRETLVAAITQVATLMRVVTHRMLLFTNRGLRALALLPNSVYNVALEQSIRLEREVRFETAVRSQQLVVDQGFETRQSGLIFAEYNKRFSAMLLSRIQAIEKNIDWEKPDVRLPFQVADPNLEGELVNLDDPNLPVEQMAALLTRFLSMHFAENLLRIQPENTVVNFLNYLDPRADRLGERLVANCAPQAKLITPVPARHNLLFLPRPNSSAGTVYMQALLSELQHHMGDVHVLQITNPDRLTLFRFYGGLGLENLFTYHQSEPRKLDPAELKQYVLFPL